MYMYVYVYIYIYVLIGSASSVYFVEAILPLHALHPPLRNARVTAWVAAAATV